MGRLLGVAALLVASLAFAGAGRAATVPNEPVWGQEWALHKLQMPDVWDITTGSPDVVIATVDTGVNPAIGDLQGALVPGWDFIQDDAVPRDTQGHGTHLASALVARGNNGQGIAGLCWQCKLMPVRVSDDGSATGGEIAEGINWAVTHGARIIVIGLNAGGAPDPAERQAVLNAAARGVLVVASAGNTGTSELRYPAAFPEVLAVGATNDFDQLYFWSTRGPWVKLAAPGCMMIIDAAVGPGTLCGTSFTPAAVAGVAALLFSLNPGLTMYQVHAALVSTAIPVAGIGGGRLNPLGARPATGLGAAASSAAGPDTLASAGGQRAAGGDRQGGEVRLPDRLQARGCEAPRDADAAARPGAARGALPGGARRGVPDHGQRPEGPAVPLAAATGRPDAAELHAAGQGGSVPGRRGVRPRAASLLHADGLGLATRGAGHDGLAAPVASGAAEPPSPSGGRPGRPGWRRSDGSTRVGGGT
jgi:uncharacterized protein (DUF697 family)